MKHHLAIIGLLVMLLPSACSDDPADGDGGADAAATADGGGEDALSADDVAGDTQADIGGGAVDSSSPVDATPNPAQDVPVADSGEPEDATVVDVPSDSSNDDAAQGQTDAATNADGGESVDAAGDVDKPACPPVKIFDYKCTDGDPKSCPGGSCVFGMCIGPVLDPLRWKDCGDGTCQTCETADTCPADCGAIPKLSGSKVWKNDTTISIWVHGFTNKSEEKLAKTPYGEVKGCGDVFEKMQKLGVKRPCGDTPEGAKKPNQLVAVEYYGKKPAAWLSAKDVKEIEAWPYDKGALGLQRYALIVAKFARHRLKSSAATHINFICHSMGCLIIRHLLENNYENLAAENRIVRWMTNTGVIAGARLARLYDNPAIQQGAKALGLELSDFVLMNPDYVMDTTAWWDHKLYEGNNPLLAGTLIHHTVATDPKIKEALGIQLLDLNNPGDEPNDGIMYTLDQYFHSQSDAASAVTAAGKKLPSTRSYGYHDHMTNPGTEAVGVLAAAALVGARKVVIRLQEVELHDDLEQDNPLDFSQAGQAPADVAAEVLVRYDPWVKKKLGKDVKVSEVRIDHRSAEMFQMKEKSTKKPGLVLFSGPVHDDMKALSLQVKLMETDWYPRFNIKETLPGIGAMHKPLATFSGQVQLVDKVIEVKDKAARMVLSVTVHKMY